LENLVILSGSSNPKLAALVADKLGLPLGHCSVERFPDGEISVRIEEAVRARHVFIVQSSSPPVNDNLVELLLLVDTCRRSAASRITAIIPYFGYARSDKQPGPQEPIAARLVAHLLQGAGVSDVISIDIHAPQIVEFFSIPFTNLSSLSPLCAVLSNRLPRELVVVSPDAGRMKTAADYATQLGASTAIMEKQRYASKMEIRLVNGDVRGRPCLIVDDMISSGATLNMSTAALLDAGASSEIFVAAAHGLFLEGSYESLIKRGVCELFVTDTVLAGDEPRSKVQIVSIASVLAAEIVKSTSRTAFPSR
jgi:ribose-phosphate pyrophosphokinase